ncbi:hypothetical protein QBC45DRAFT_465340 [Copromyces sp. CBS 386.78]|nr:hypothetical protein QBC45DRAFT_465340 [Copromyces sp. CBS 386.78]
MSLDCLSAPLYSLQDLAQEATDRGAACSSVVDSVDIMSILGHLISRSTTQNKPTFTKSTLAEPMSPFPTSTPTPIRTSSAPLLRLTTKFVHSSRWRYHRALVSFSTIRQYTCRSRRRRSTRRHPLPHSQLKKRTIIHKMITRSSPKRHDMRRLRTYRPAWYQEKLQRELEESKRSEKLDEERRLELLELVAELLELRAELDIMLDVLARVTQAILRQLALRLQEQMEQEDEDETDEDWLSEEWWYRPPWFYFR